MNSYKHIEKKCAQYLLEEPNEVLKSEMRDLLDANTEDSRHELVSRMSHHLRFGTAGLRARMEAGYNRMNKVSVYRFSYALGHEICQGRQGSTDVVLGFDGRKNSRDFAEEVAVTLGSMGANVHLFDMNIPTPICAYATKHLQAAIGIMITASHNPSYDNGIKIFDRRSAQVTGPALQRIETNMALAPLRPDFIGDHEGYIRHFSPKKIGDEIIASYLHDIKQTQFFASDLLDHNVGIVYTPLHGVGKKFFLQALSQEGFNKVVVVAEQAEPDGGFPTVAFPNPEENHTLDRADMLAIATKCEWVFANDPDADRLQVSCYNSSGRFSKLSGNEMGSILGYFAILRAQEMGIKPLLASSIVSSRMLRAMCLQMGAHYVDSLTGFSNIADSAMRAETNGDHVFVFGYEEAIGFLVGQVVLDKDGINAGARFMEIVGYLSKSNKTIWQLLDELYLRFGLYVNTQWSMRFDDIAAMTTMAKMMAKVRALSTSEVANCLGQSECKKFDLSFEQKNNCYEGLRADVVIFEINQVVRLIVRPSGTEPKIKFYLELFDRATDLHLLSNKRSQLREKIAEQRANIEILFNKKEA